jgi:hypothetical protein
MSVEYTHDQTDSSDTWTVIHGLNTYPVTDVVITYQGQRQKVMPKSVEYVDANTVVVKFSEPRTGNLRAIGEHKFVLEPNVTPITAPPTVGVMHLVMHDSFTGSAGDLSGHAPDLIADGLASATWQTDPYSWPLYLTGNGEVKDDNRVTGDKQSAALIDITSPIPKNAVLEFSYSPAVPNPQQSNTDASVYFTIGSLQAVVEIQSYASTVNIRIDVPGHSYYYSENIPYTTIRSFLCKLELNLVMGTMQFSVNGTVVESGAMPNFNQSYLDSTLHEITLICGNDGTNYGTTHSVFTDLKLYTDGA